MMAKKKTSKKPGKKAAAKKPAKKIIKSKNVCEFC